MEIQDHRPCACWAEQVGRCSLLQETAEEGCVKKELSTLRLDPRRTTSSEVEPGQAQPTSRARRRLQ